MPNSPTEANGKTQRIITSGVPFHQMFEAQVQQFPDSTAVRFGTDRLSYSELNARSNQLAHHLKTIGVTADVMVGLHVARSMDAIIAMLAILKAGGAYIPLDPSYPQERLSYMLADARLSILIARADEQSELLDKFNEQAVTSVLLDAHADIISKQSREDLDIKISPDDLMYVIYTSGSTGNPKGVMVNHANVTRLFSASQTHFHFDEHDVWTLYHSYSFGFSVWEIWGALVHGSTLVIVPPAVSQDPDAFHRLVNEEKITVLSQTPSAFSLFQLADAVSKQSHDLSVRYIVFSGESLDPSLLETWMQKRGDEQPQLINMYAITETAGEITYRRMRQTELSDDKCNVIGIPLPDVHIYLLDDSQKPVLKGELGEMYISSTAVVRGYLNLPELTEQSFLSDPFRRDKNVRMYKTGDQARCLSNGEIEFLGRVDDQVKIRGYRVESGEIQRILMQHKSVAEAIVVAQSGTNNIPMLVAYIVTKAASLTSRELQNYLKITLPDYMIPSAFITLDSLPRSPNGKIDRQALTLANDVTAKTTMDYVVQTAEEKALGALWNVNAPPKRINILSARDQQAAILPQTPMEKSLAAIWSKVLGHPMIALNDNFFELGGNSLLAAQILYQTNDEFDVILSMRQLMDNSSIAELSKLITEQQESDEFSNILSGLAELSNEEAQQLLSESMDYVAQTAEEKTLVDLCDFNIPSKSINILNAEYRDNGSVLDTSTPMEKSLVAIWSEAFNHPTITLSDNFFELGGDSLLAMYILDQINDEFDITLSISQLMEHSSITELSKLITEQQSESDELSNILSGLAELSNEEAQQLLSESMDVTEPSVEIETKEVASSEYQVSQDETYMRMAIDEANVAILNEQNPVAACIVKDGAMIACVHNQVSQQTDITAHAEMLAIRAACKQLNTLDLSGCVLYSTLEPCPMCFSASHLAGIDKIIYGARRDDAIKFGLSSESIPVYAIQKLLNSPIELVEDSLRDDNVTVFKAWLNAKNSDHIQYDDIATQFRQTKDSPINKYVTDYTFFNMLDSLDKDKKVLDLACGEGHVCRALKQRGARHVVGVDISVEMIKLAKQQEKQEPLGVEYICQDVLELGTIGEFDLVVASFLLNYAKTENQLIKMCQTAFDNLKSGGYFILINENFEQSPDDYQGYEHYGYTKTITKPWQEGVEITHIMSTGSEELKFNGYYWAKETYQSAFKTAGFNELQLHNLSCSSQGIEEYGHKFWQNFIDSPPFIGIIANKK